jgi:two-component system CheB/CheR fusion protein
MRSHLKFPVVGIGASAGGLQALISLFENMPDDCGMAFVVVMHLSPKHESSLDHILQKATDMPVRTVAKPVPIEANTVYVIPPGMDLSMNDGYLRLATPQRTRGMHVAIDLFFRALAEVHQTHSIAVVLSGSGADGAVGMARIKEMGGITLAQSPDEAEFASMPRSAIESGVVDIVLPVAELAQRLVFLSQNIKALNIPLADAPPEAQKTPDQQLAKSSEVALREILNQLRLRTGHDFKHYKQATVLRRIERRMQVNGISDMPTYAHFLNERMEETSALLDDMLIGVTNFFRDPEAFEAVERDLIPALFDKPGEGDAEPQIRVWSVACSTGEEAYSLCMLLSEHAEQKQSSAELHVFATDIDDNALNIARASLYPESILTDVSPARLRQFFTKESAYYRVKKEVREKILFATHNILRDPPFSRLDMISCRNLLIYLDRDIQAEVLRMFHFALNPGGFLFLGSSETADACPHLFTAVDKKNRIYRAKNSAHRRPTIPVSSFAGPLPMPMPMPMSMSMSRGLRVPERKPSFADVHQRVLEQYAPPSVIVNFESDIVHMSARAGKYLRYIGGEPTLNLPTVVHPELRLELRTALYQAIKTGKSVDARRVKIDQDGRSSYINMVVKPFRDSESAGDYVLVLFDEVDDSLETGPTTTTGKKDSVLTHLEAELQQTKEQLQQTMEHSDASTEELRASNEELQAINEELRSATEELETSKEELQSINEELVTVNAELKVKVDEASKITDDLQNLISSTDIATLFVDRQMRIKWFTPRSSDIFNVIRNDAGRSILDITHRLDYPDLISDANRAFEELRLVEREVTSSDGRWYLARFLPYRTTDDRIQGAVLTFIDITSRRFAEERMRAGEAHTKLLAQSIQAYAIVTVDCDGVVTTWNSGAQLLFGHGAEAMVGRSLSLIYSAEDREQGRPAQDRRHAETEGQLGETRTYLRQNGSRVPCHVLLQPMFEGDSLRGFALVAHDLTEQQRRADESENQLFTAQASNERKDEFFAVLSHELKHPLNLIQLNMDVMTRTPLYKTSPQLTRAGESIQAAVRNQSRIIDDLMDISRVRTGKLNLNLAVRDLNESVRSTFGMFKPIAESEQIELLWQDSDEHLFVNADTTRLEQVIWNLLNNALKFTPAGGRVSLAVSREGDLARLDVVDTGQGIAPDFIGKVFDLFGQAEMQHVHRSKNGLGIGLALVQQLVEAHGGRIEAFSEGMGRGARFSVWLPICLQTELQLKESERAAAMAGSLSGVQVLVVDDSPEILSVMEMLLEGEDAIVTLAENGELGLAVAKARGFDLILSDIGMPVLDGHQMMRAIRAGSANQQTPAIALSGYSTKQDVDEAVAAGFHLHLQKPVAMDTLLEAVASLLKKT